MPYWNAMIDHDAYVLRESTGTSGVIGTARPAAGRPADHLKVTRDGLKAEK
jgi:hypothetical protein